MSDDLVVAKARFISFHEGNGVPIVVEHRSIARMTHPVVMAQPGQWEPLSVDFDVEAPKKRGKADQ